MISVNNKELRGKHGGGGGLTISIFIHCGISDRVLVGIVSYGIHRPGRGASISGPFKIRSRLGHLPVRIKRAKFSVLISQISGRETETYFETASTACNRRGRVAINMAVRCIMSGRRAGPGA